MYSTYSLHSSHSCCKDANLGSCEDQTFAKSDTVKQCIAKMICKSDTLGFKISSIMLRKKHTKFNINNCSCQTRLSKQIIKKGRSVTIH